MGLSARAFHRIHARLSDVHGTINRMKYGDLQESVTEGAAMLIQLEEMRKTLSACVGEVLACDMPEFENADVLIQDDGTILVTEE